MECEKIILSLIILVAGVSGAKLSKPLSQCKRLHCIRYPVCISCDYPTCNMGERVSVNCSTVPECTNQESAKKMAYCNYCWQLDESLYDCAPRSNCSSASTKTIVTTCEVHPNIICKGSRRFSKRIKCNWSSGASWTKAMFFSVTLGGLGVDRFYLGLWKSGIGKLFSFGGLGVWTVVDIVLIATGYIRPADGSMYM